MERIKEEGFTPTGGGFHSPLVEGFTVDRWREAPIAELQRATVVVIVDRDSGTSLTSGFVLGTSPSVIGGRNHSPMSVV